MANENYLIALEGGGTRSQAVLMDLQGNVLQISEGGDVNTNFTSFQQAQQSVYGAVESVLRAADVQGDQIRQLVSALVGPKFGQETFGSLCPNASFSYFGERDVVFARASIYEPHGVAVVAATGATAFGMRKDTGRQISLGGWGSLLGDEGSAYAMGLMGLRAAVKAYEERESQPTRLVEGISEKLGLTRANFHRGLVELAYSKPLSRAEIGGLAAVVTLLAQEGDLVASRIARQTAEDLADLAMHAVTRLFESEENFDVVVAGGMTNAGDLILGPLRARLSAGYPRAQLFTGTEPPAVSLGRLALYHMTHSVRRYDANRTVF